MRKSILAVALVGVGAACGSGANPDAAAQDQASGGQGSGAGAVAVETAAWPTNQCGWITVAEVEAVIGPLAGPPRSEDGGCLYPIPLNEETAKRREAARKLGELAKEWAKREGTTLDTTMNRMPTEAAFIVDVNFDINNTGERALRAVEKIGAAWLGGDSSLVASKDANAEWDYSQSPISMGLPGFLGRVGQLTVMVRPQATSYEQAQIEALAAAVRDKVPDKPFPSRSPQEQEYLGAPQSGPDPCSLLTAAEAEAVLGPLTVPPYRVGEMQPHPDPRGDSCAYRTARHRVFRIKPIWSGGTSELELVRGLGGLIGLVMPGDKAEAADTIEGPWEEAAWDNSTGDLLLRVGDRAIQLSFGTSSTDAKGVLRLVPAALGRLRSAR